MKSVPVISGVGIVVSSRSGQVYDTLPSRPRSCAVGAHKAGLDAEGARSRRRRRPPLLAIRQDAVMASNAEQREHDVVVYGATGFVGKLTAQYLAEHGPAD